MRSMIIMPTYNERDNLERIAGLVLGQEQGFWLTIVDDNSPDGTGQVADQLAATHERVHVIHRKGKLGLGTAYITGFKYALAQGMDYIFEMDADLSHGPEYLPRFLAELEHYDVVLGSRYIPGGGTTHWGLGRRLISRGGSLYTRLILGLPVNDCTGGFNAFRRQVLMAIDLDRITSNGYSFQIELKYRCHRKGFRLHEIPINFVDRRAGRSKMSRQIFMEAMLKVWQLRFGR